MDLETLLSDARMFLSTWWIRSRHSSGPEEFDREDGWVHCPGPHGCLMHPDALSDGSMCCVEIPGSPEIPEHIENEALGIRYRIDLLPDGPLFQDRADVLMLVRSFLEAHHKNVAFGTRAGLTMQEGWARRLYSDIESWSNCVVFADEQICADAGDEQC